MIYKLIQHVRGIVQLTDIFGIQISFLVSKQSRHQTCFGGALTLVLFSVLALSIVESVNVVQTSQKIMVNTL
jgi:hypothetical protein